MIEGLAGPELADHAGQFLGVDSTCLNVLDAAEAALDLPKPLVEFVRHRRAFLGDRWQGRCPDEDAKERQVGELSSEPVALEPDLLGRHQNDHVVVTDGYPALGQFPLVPLDVVLDQVL